MTPTAVDRFCDRRMRSSCGSVVVTFDEPPEECEQWRQTFVSRNRHPWQGTVVVSLKVRPCQTDEEKIVVARNPDAREKTLGACYSMDENWAIRWKATRAGSISTVIRSLNERSLKRLVAEYLAWLLRDCSDSEAHAIRWYAKSRNESLIVVARSAFVNRDRKSSILQLFHERKCV